MKKLYWLLVIGFFVFFTGCDPEEFKSKMEKKSNNKQQEIVKHRQTIWKEGCISMENIDGHIYFVTHLRACSYGSVGCVSIVHADEHCPCKHNVLQ